MVKVTNAIKDTVSVLYWYEELSSFTTGNFWNGSSELFFVRAGFPPPPPVTISVLFLYFFCGFPAKNGSTTLRVPKSSLTSVLTKPVAA